MNTSRMMATPEAAAYLGISTSQTNKLRVFGTGPKFIKIGRRVLYRVEDLDEFIAENERSSTSEGGETK